MKTSTKLALCLAQAAVLSWAATTASQAQTIVPSSTNPYGTCVPFDAENVKYTFTPGNSSQVLTGWSTKGDLTITGQSGNEVTVSAKPSSGSRFGRGRIIANFNSGASCPQSVSYDVNKTFTPSQFVAARPDLAIIGPGPSTCVVAGSKIAFSIEPVLSSAAQIAQQIGIDTYKWNFGPEGSLPYLPKYSGDGSAVQITAPNSAFSVNVTIGSCNSAGSPHLFKSYGIQAPAPAITGAPTCLPTTSTGSANAFSLSTSTVPGVTYQWILPAGWSSPTPNATTGILGTGGTQTISVYPGDGNAGISVVALAGGSNCTAIASVPVTITRQLAAGMNDLSVPTGCLTVGSSVILSVSNPPANSMFQWGLPSGWTITGSPAYGTITATVGAAGAITVRANNCASGTLTKNVTVSGTNGCTFTVDDPLGCGQYRVRGAPSTTCVGNQFDWTITNATSSAILANGSTTVNFWKPIVAIPSGSKVSVRVRNATACLAAQSGVLTTAYDSNPNDQCRVLSTNPKADGGLVVAYPNPAGNELLVKLPTPQKGKTNLVLVDELGRIVLNASTTETQQALSVRRLANGSYTLRATLPDGKVVSQKIMVQH